MCSDGNISIPIRARYHRGKPYELYSTFLDTTLKKDKALRI